MYLTPRNYVNKWIIKCFQMNEIYHERQSKELCALHALNNIFQDKSAFTQVSYVCKATVVVSKPNKKR